MGLRITSSGQTTATQEINPFHPVLAAEREGYSVYGAKSLVVSVMAQMREFRR